MRAFRLEREIIVRPINGMQLSEGYIWEDEPQHYSGRLPGIEPSVGDTVDEVLKQLDRKVKAYYGDDVIVELCTRVVA